MIALSAASLAASHWLVFGKGWGGRATKVLLILTTLIALILWFAPIHVD